jgi:hypothetical protein
MGDTNDNPRGNREELFDIWNRSKNKIDASSTAKIPYFEEREISFISVGQNVGNEQSSSNLNFSRPVLVFRKFSSRTFIGIPISSKYKTGPYYAEIKKGGINGVVILSQIRLFDSLRMLRKETTLSIEEFERVKNKLFEVLFSKTKPRC